MFKVVPVTHVSFCLVNKISIGVCTFVLCLILTLFLETQDKTLVQTTNDISSVPQFNRETICLSYLPLPY